MRALNDLKAELLNRCYEDYVGLWVLIWKLRHDFPDANADQLRFMTIELAKSLLEEENIRAGQFNKKGRFEYWDMSVSDIVNKIVEEWNRLGKEPDIGDITWFIAE